ncbi:MAG TPA: hypothetical protein PKE26_01340 [Kiritimatiellia bacterium]|nr:hypothetical protein [Kiritimatiellia bacterium]HMO97736.1 hypothetical protein [Kiritimatiellia bacterium]HMP95375.1 hypothetical protein [Kiritimatiellia bacterium]
MKSWWQRHVLLTGEERLLIGGILLIVLIGLTATYCRRADADENPRSPANRPAAVR